MTQKYYWLKLKRDFFKRHDIRIIESMQNGKDYILFYLKLLCESVDHEGNLRFSEQIPYNEEMLATITNTNIDIVRSAIKVFTQLNMMEVMDDGTYYMAEVEKMIGSATNNDNANRQRRFRERKKALMISEDVTKNNAGITQSVTEDNESKSIEKDIEIDKEKDINKKKTGSAAYEDIISESITHENVKEAIREFIKMRKLIKSPMTEHALKLMINKLQGMSGDPAMQIAILNQSIENSWKGIFPLREETTKKNKTAQQLDQSYEIISAWAESEE